MRTSTLTSKYQATIPTSVRKKMNLHAGDKIAFEITGNQVYLVKVAPFDLAYHQALESTLSEWNAKEDDVYNDL
ncbi:MAG: type II toxin-antitoxin system PrlF family antitoxin [Gammaproteobacteria bacterium]|nr:type II toxin-antitoxin system PrlF family antitoxin [Gammaproteobacteria bacterium]